MAFNMAVIIARARPAFRSSTRLSRPAVLLLVLVGLVFLPPPAVSAEPDEARYFREQIEPVLKAECYGCHSSGSASVKGGLRLDSKVSLRRGGDSGPVLVPGDPAASLLIQAVRHLGGLEMPPHKPKLPDATIAALIHWIDAGAPDPRDEHGNDAASGGDAPREKSPPVGSRDPAEARRHWSFQPVRKLAPELPRDADHRAASLVTPIDAFIIQQLRERGSDPAPPADRADWIRRVSFDLSGLPPTPEEVAAFEQDASPDARERLVDQLLASPQYGQRWAQHWLDVVRYAETEGYEYDRQIPDAWRFRDYVIDSLNADKPFDRFVTEQIAGDEIAGDQIAGDQIAGDQIAGDQIAGDTIDSASVECLVASIFHRLGPVRRNAGNPEIALSRNEVLTERTDILGTAILGLTIGCARCHDHKLEPISQKDYYRLQAYLAATEERSVSLASSGEQKAWEEKTRQANEEIQRLKKQAQQLTGDEQARLLEVIELREDALPAPLPTIPATRNDFAKRTPIHVLRRGDWASKGEPVGPRPPSVLVPDTAPELSADVSDPRTQLARWLVSLDQPLTARVLVNRLWQHHFGQGFVRTSNDFGLRGDRPSHPELLDWLAATLVEHGWRLKPLHRLIVLSGTYGQSSRLATSPRAASADPENRLLWKFPRRRLSAEEVRDAMLAVSGRLNRRIGGPSVMIPTDPDLVKLLYKPSQWSVTSDPREHDRRSIYLAAKRNLRLPFLEILDAPALLTSCAARQSSTHAPQVLELLNGEIANGLADAFARRLVQETGGDQQFLVERAFRLALGRSCSASERAMAMEFLRDQPLRELTLAIFNLNEFVYVR